tara:strand:+ start:1459 stop:2232 length:774 start_codon:yes stop_codon:yes gene_type:complete
MNILITGGNGYIAKSLSNRLNNTISITRNDFDLTDRKATDEWFKGKYFDVVIHTAAVGGSRLKEDDADTFYQNIQMMMNLFNNKHYFGKLIHFGSGAELGMPNDPYGLSKKVISNIIDTEPFFYNIRIYSVFDENELDTRFIKSNIKRYINKENICLYQDKLMDFFYMKDLVKLIKYYIDNNDMRKNIDCSYYKKYSLLDIAHIINNLSDYKVDIISKPVKFKVKDYIGDFCLPDLKWVGLEQGIKETYKKLLDETN